MFSRVYFGRYFAPTYFGPAEATVGVEPLDLAGMLSRGLAITGRYAPTMAVHGLSAPLALNGTW
jgi:hypothetical protein